MSQDTRSEHEAEDLEETSAAGAPMEDEAGESEPGDRMAELEARCEELNAKWLRAQADYKNLRRRSLSDLETGLRRGMLPLLEELLLVLDFLDMALASPTESADAKNLHTGVEMTRTKLMAALEAAEVAPIPIDGPFDPEIHEAVEARTATDVEPGTILEVVRAGYTWRETVLRVARVVVATEEREAGTEEG